MFVGSDQYWIVGIRQHLRVILAITQSHYLKVFAVD